MVFHMVRTLHTGPLFNLDHLYVCRNKTLITFSSSGLIKAVRGTHSTGSVLHGSRVTLLLHSAHTLQNLPHYNVTYSNHSNNNKYNNNNLIIMYFYRIIREAMEGCCKVNNVGKKQLFKKLPCFKIRFKRELHLLFTIFNTLLSVAVN